MAGPPAQRLTVTKQIKAFVAKAPQREAEARAILKTAPGVGPVTAEVVLSELGDISRFRNTKAVCAGVIAPVPRIMRLFWVFYPSNPPESPYQEESSLASMLDTPDTRSRSVG